VPSIPPAPQLKQPHDTPQLHPTSPRVASPIPQPKVKFTLTASPRMENPTSHVHQTCSRTTANNSSPLAPPLSHTPVSSCTRSHTALLSPLPTPPAANTHLPSLPTGLPQPALSTEQHQSLMKTRAISLNGANCVTNPPSPLPGTLPMQTNWGAFAKALAPVPMKAKASKASTPSSPFPTTRSHPTAVEKSPTSRLFARSNQRREMMPTPHASPLAETTSLIPEM
jgi:hypothetical protein